MFVNNLELPARLVAMLNQGIWKNLDFSKLGRYIGTSCEKGMPYNLSQMEMETDSLIAGIHNKEDWSYDLFVAENRIINTSDRVCCNQIVAIRDYDYADSPICLFYGSDLKVPSIIFFYDEDDEQADASWKELAPDFDHLVKILGK